MLFQQGSDTYTYTQDTTAFENPSGDNQHYDIPPPEGWTQEQFDQSVINSGLFYNLPGNYDALMGPNSNTAADNIIEQAGGNMPEIDRAWQKNYGE